MNRITRALLPLLALLLFLPFACTERVSWEFPQFEPVPTVNAVLVAGEPFQVHVSLTGKFDTVPLPTEKGAVVTLYANGEVYGTLDHIGNGLYASNLRVQPNVEYRCEVTIPGYVTVTTSCTVPKPVPIVGIKHTNRAGVDTEGLTYPSVSVTFPNRPSEIQYYEIKIYMIEYEDYTGTASHYYISDPVLLSEGLPILVFSNVTIGGDEYTMTINYFTGSAEGSGGGVQTNLFPLFLELRTVCYNYYMHKRMLYLYDTGRYPEIIGGVVTPFPLHSNVEGGYGIFGGYSSVFSETIYPNANE